MPSTRSRRILALAMAGALIAAVVTVAPANAEDPPLEWTPMAGFPLTTPDGGTTVSIETAVMPSDTFGLLTDFPFQRVDIRNNDDAGTRYYHFGIDVKSEGVIEPLWRAETFGAWGFPEDYLATVALGPGESIVDTDAAVYHGIPGTLPGAPVYPGRTAVVYEFTEDPVLNPDAVATEIARAPTAPGEFVPMHFEREFTPEGTIQVGQELTVVGPGAPDDVQLYPGVTATVEASGLPGNRELELWLAPALDYFYSVLLGSVMLDTAKFLGTVTTAADGTLSVPFTVPADVEFNVNYRLFAGSAEDRYWPGGTYRSFAITAPLAGGTADVSGDDTEARVPLGSTSVDFAFQAGTAGTWSASVSTTGPVVTRFTLAGNVPLYYHLDFSESLGGAEVEVCINYSIDNIPGSPPRLYHFAPADGGGYQWTDITTTRVPGRVCGITTSFSPFGLAHPDTFDFSGFFSPVSMGEQNVANPGQAIPVKFSLEGYQGLDVIESAKFVAQGTATNPTGDVLDAVTPGKSQLTYDAKSDRYTYVWKTEKSWAKKTGMFVLTLSDGTTHTFDVAFKK